VHRSSICRVVAAILLLLPGPGCNPAGPATAPPAKNAGAGSGGSEPTLRKVDLQLNWFPDAQHGGFYAAVTNGCYAAEGLDVHIVPGGPTAVVIPKVVMNRVPFAVANADQILLARQQQADIVAVFASMQNSPRCIMVHESSGITKLEELHDMVLAIGDGKAFAEYLKHKLPLPGVRLVSYSGNVAKFLVDENFAQQGYVFSEPLVVRARGGSARALMVSDLGFNPYSSVVITSESLWKQDPELVRRFVRASQRGWQTYLQDPSRANAAILKDNPEMDAEILRDSVAIIQSLVLPADVPAQQLGTMQSQRWVTLESQLQAIGLLPADSRTAAGAFVLPLEN